jgi:hypothetical protein
MFRFYLHCPSFISLSTRASEVPHYFLYFLPYKTTLNELHTLDMPACAASFSGQYQKFPNIASDSMRSVWRKTRQGFAKFNILIYKKFGICSHGSCLHVRPILKINTVPVDIKETCFHADDVRWEVRIEIV